MPKMPSTDPLGHWRGKVAGLIRSRESDDPELVFARRRLDEEMLALALLAALEKAPTEITPEFRKRIVDLLAPVCDGPMPRKRRQAVSA
jgi:hypothetical protein